MQVVTDLLVKAGSGTPAQRLQSAASLAALLEAEEERFEDIVGNPNWLPNQRNQFNIGRALAVVKVGRRLEAAAPHPAPQLCLPPPLPHH